MAIVEVIDERRTDPARRLIATFERVPDQWPINLILERFGIADHLGVRITRDFPFGGDQVVYRHPVGTSIISIR